MTPLVFLIWLGTAAILFVATFVFYVAIMKMREIKSEIYRLHWSVRWVCYLVVFIGLIINTALNWILLTVAFVELPEEFLCTDRVIRHKYESTGWRQAQALWWCRHFLSPFDQSHCEK